MVVPEANAKTDMYCLSLTRFARAAFPTKKAIVEAIMGITTAFMKKIAERIRYPSRISVSLATVEKNADKIRKPMDF